MSKIKKTVSIIPGYRCNNNCLFCIEAHKRKWDWKDRTTKEVKRALKQTKNPQNKNLVLTGGEVTIRKDIVEIIQYAQSLGFKGIEIQTNGRMLSYNDFAKKIIDCGTGRINFSLHGNNAKLQDAITRTPKSFEQAIKGIKNISKYQENIPNLRIIINTVVCSLNHKHLLEIGKFISSLGIKFLNIQDLIPDGFAKDFYKTLVVRMNDLSLSLNNLEKILAKFNQVTFFDFPFCLFSADLRKVSHTAFISIQRRGKKIEICKDCKFYKECGGVWSDYLDLYGQEEITALARKHLCLKR